MNEFSIRGLVKLYEKNLDRAENMLESSEIQDVEYYRNKLKLEHAKRDFYNRYKDIYVNTKNPNQLISDNVVIVFLIQMLYSNIDMLNIKAHRFDFNYRLNFEDEIDSFLNTKGSQYMEIPYIKYYYYTYKLLKTKDESFYHMLKDFAVTSFDKLTKDEISFVLTILTNYCSARVMQGDDHFNEELFNLYIFRIDKNFHLNNAGKVSHVFFINAAEIGLMLNKMEWVEQFVAEKQFELKVESRVDTVRYCNACIKYHKKDYDGALRELSTITSADLPYKLSVKHLVMQILFSANEIEQFLSHVDSYRHFISNTEQISEKLKEDLNTYINFTKKIFSIKNELGKQNESDLISLKRELNESSIYGKSWLVKKIEEIGNS
jgi:hypothetical protein